MNRLSKIEALIIEDFLDRAHKRSGMRDQLEHNRHVAVSG